MSEERTYADRLSDLEALLFAAGEPLSLKTLQAILDWSEPVLAATIDDLLRRYRRDPTSGLTLRNLDGRYTLSTKTDKIEIIARLYRPEHRPALTQASYEVLAIVAYNREVTRAEIEDVRGVNSDGTLARLVERGYVVAIGRDESPGRPMRFSVSEVFLREFGLSSIDELPAVDLLSYETVSGLTRQFREAEEERLF